MNKLSFIIAILMLAVMSYSESKPTDYINGKWYSCNIAKVNEYGDTLYTRAHGTESWYSYNSELMLSSIKSKYVGGSGRVFMTRYSYTSTGKLRKKTISAGTYIYSYEEYVYGKNDILIKKTDIKTFSDGTKDRFVTTYAYDSLGNMIYKKVISFANHNSGVSETWFNYEGGIKKSSRTIYDGTIDGSNAEYNVYREYHDNGNEKYHRWEYIRGFHRDTDTHITETYYDRHGNLIKTRNYSQNSEIPEYDEYHVIYDSEGRLIYDGWRGLSYTYFTIGDTRYQCEDS